MSDYLGLILVDEKNDMDKVIEEMINNRSIFEGQVIMVVMKGEGEGEGGVELVGVGMFVREYLVAIKNGEGSAILGKDGEAIDTRTFVEKLLETEK